MGQVVLPDDVVSVLQSDGRVRQAELTGSRARGTVSPLSDWDFAVTVTAFKAVRDAMPSLTAPLQPVVAQWDWLSRNWCYMMILTGPVKVDLIFDRPHRADPPWLVSSSTLQQIDDHFWDTAPWLGSKRLAGRSDVVTLELRKLHAHLLGPLGVATGPTNLGQAVVEYQAARDNYEKAFHFQVSRAGPLP